MIIGFDDWEKFIKNKFNKSGKTIDTELITLCYKINQWISILYATIDVLGVAEATPKKCHKRDNRKFHRFQC